MATILAFFTNFPFELFVIQTLNGIVTGMILALIASGLTLIFGIMDVVNFAHGELFMLGAYVGVLVLSTTGSFALALIIATLGIGLFGAVALATSALGPAVAEPIAARFGARPLFLISAVVGLAGAWFCRRLTTGAPVKAADLAAKNGSGTARSRAFVIGVLAVGSLAAAAVSTFHSAAS